MNVTDDGAGLMAEMGEVVQWLPLVWQHVNRLLETHGGADVTVGKHRA